MESPRAFFTPQLSTPLTPPIPIFRPSELSLDIDRTRREDVRGGVSTGYTNLDSYVTVRPGAPIFIAGSPYAGKSTFTKQILVNLSRLHGWRHCVYLGEEGSVADLTIDLVEMYTGRPARIHADDGTENPNAMGESEFIAAMTWVDDHFWIVNPDAADVDSFTIDMFFEWVRRCEVEQGIKFNTTVVDPWNDLVMDLDGKGGREDLFLADALKTVRDSSRTNERVDIIVTHIAAPHLKHVSDRGRRYAAPAEPYEWAGGQTWYRRAFTMILVYRPPSPDSIRMGKVAMETREGETWVMVQKVKPRGVGKVGTCRLWFDDARQQYTEEPPSE